MSPEEHDRLLRQMAADMRYISAVKGKNPINIIIVIAMFAGLILFPLAFFIDYLTGNLTSPHHEQTHHVIRLQPARRQR